MIDDSNIKFNPDEFCEIFAKNAPISIGKQKNIEMVLSEIKLKPIDLSYAILEYNEDILTKDIINLLIPIMPTNTEYDEISKKTETLENEEDFVEHELLLF